MDLCGFPKTAFYMNQAYWIEDKPILQIVPHWNWAGREGQPIRVKAIANCDTVALSLNGQSLGEKAVDKFDFAEWQVPYASGRLEAVGKKAGKEVSRCVVETTGEAVALQVVPDRAVLAGDGWDAQPVTIQAVDAQGRVVPTAKLMAEFEISGSGDIIGVGNGDPNCHESDKDSRRSLFNGLAQVIVRTRAGSEGKLVLRAKADGLKPGEASIEINKKPAHPAVGTARPPMYLQNWLMSPQSNIRPNPNAEFSDKELSTWTSVEAAWVQSHPDGAFVIYQFPFEPTPEKNAVGGKILFPGIRGKAEVWLDGKLVGKKDDFKDAGLTVEFPPGTGSRLLRVLIEAETKSGQQAGFGALPRVE